MAMMSITFSAESMIRGYHEYKVIWYNPLVGEDLLSEHEVGNLHNTHAVWSHVAKLLFSAFVWGQGNSYPDIKRKGGQVWSHKTTRCSN